MILAFSTSSAYASVAAISQSGELIWQGSVQAPTSASAACFDLLDRLKSESGLDPNHAELYLADIGPGSFTGVRVGVVIAKTFAYLNGRSVAGANSFDLIAPDKTAVLPSKRGEFFIRVPGNSAYSSVDLPEGSDIGFGPGIDDQVYPSAGGFVRLLTQLKPCSAMEFVPEYLIEPSISIPKSPFKKIVDGSPA